MDEADITEARREAEEQFARINRERRAAVQVQGPELCEECEAVMPQLRRDWGLKLCTECQTAHEKRASHFFGTLG